MVVKLISELMIRIFGIHKTSKNYSF